MTTATTLEPSDTRLERDAACGSCGYNLRGLRLSDTCPECGSSVEKSLREELPYETQRELHWTISGLRLTALGLGIGTLPWLASLTHWLLPPFWLYSAGPMSFWDGVLYSLPGGWLPLIVGVATLTIGVWMLMEARKRDTTRLRMIVARFGVPMMIAFPPVALQFDSIRRVFFWGAYSPYHSMYLSGVVYWICWYAGVGIVVAAAFMAVLLSLMPMIRRLRARGLRICFITLMFAAPAWVVLELIANVSESAISILLYSYSGPPPISYSLLDRTLLILHWCNLLVPPVLATAAIVLLLVLWRRLVHYASRQAV